MAGRDEGTLWTSPHGHGCGGVRGWVGRGPLESSWSCHALARPVALSGPQSHGGADQRPGFSQSSSRSSYGGPWGRSGAWASRRSSWNSLKHKPLSAEHESLLAAERSGSRACEGARDEGPPRALPLHTPHVYHAHHGSHSAHRHHYHHHHRRTLSLDTRDSVDLAELGPPVGTQPRAAWRAAGPGPGHEDCNGRMPHIAKEVFTQMGDRRDHGEDEEEVDYVSGRVGGAEGPGPGEGPRDRGRRAEGWGQGAGLRRVSGRWLELPAAHWAHPWERSPGRGVGSDLAGRVQRSPGDPSLLDGWRGQRQAALGSADQSAPPPLLARLCVSGCAR